MLIHRYCKMFRSERLGIFKQSFCALHLHFKVTAHVCISCTQEWRMFPGYYLKIYLHVVYLSMGKTCRLFYQWPPLSITELVSSQLFGTHRYFGKKGAWWGWWEWPCNQTATINWPTNRWWPWKPGSIELIRREETSKTSPIYQEWGSPFLHRKMPRDAAGEVKGEVTIRDFLEINTEKENQKRTALNISLCNFKLHCTD